MAEKKERRISVMISRAPVLILWTAVVAEVLDFYLDPVGVFELSLEKR